MMIINVVITMRKRLLSASLPVFLGVYFRYFMMRKVAIPMKKQLMLYR